MASLVKKKKGNRLYYYLVESARVDGQPRIVHQAYLGSAEKLAELGFLDLGAADSRKCEQICPHFGLNQRSGDTPWSRLYARSNVNVCVPIDDRYAEENLDLVPL